ncbi:hypothetical protein HWV62_28559 [Athelia sp. TMB]|nr:hypothetical protein HWV62_28559 [Athelia sp. TMB]
MREIMVLSPKHKKKFPKASERPEVYSEALGLKDSRPLGTGLRAENTIGNIDFDPRYSHVSGALCDGMDPRNILEAQVREQVARNRASFWDNLTDEDSTMPQNFLDLEPLSRLPLPHLRKRKSFASRLISGISATATTQKDRIKRKIRRRTQAISPSVSTSSQETSSSWDVPLPSGIVQSGNGIGFVHNSGHIALPKDSISVAQRSCLGFSLRSFSKKSISSMKQQPYSRETHSPDHETTEEQLEMQAVMREIYGSRWSLEMTAIGLAQPFDTSSCTPSSPTLNTPWLTPEMPEFLNVKEAVAGDPDATLRLVESPFIPSPHC